MIEREVELDDGRILQFHEFTESKVDLVGKKLYALTRSLESLDAVDSVTLKAVVSFFVWDPALLQGLDLLIETAELTLYTGPEKDVVTLTLEQLKLAKINYLNNEYNKANLGTFKYLNIDFNADAVAQNNINATANFINMFGTYPDDWLGVWITAAGGSIPMPDPVDFQPFYKAYVAQGVYNIARFNTLKAQVEAAETAEDLDLITW